MKHLLVIYASQSGQTQALCDAVCEGAAGLCNEVALRRKSALQADIGDLLWAHGLLIGSPENFGYMAGAVKDFLDRTYYPAQDRTNGLPYGLFISAGNDGTGAVRAIERIATGYGWKAINDPIIVRGDCSDADLQRCRELGEGMAAGLAAGVF